MNTILRNNLMNFKIIINNSRPFQFIKNRSYANVAVKFNESLLTKMENGELKPRNHPGRIKSPIIHVPNQIEKSILKCCGDNPIKKLFTDAGKLSNYINARHPPVEKIFLQQKIKEIESELDEIFPPPKDIKTMNEVEKLQYNNNRNYKAQQMLKHRIYTWKPINYGKYESLVYAIGRSALEYAILSKVFNEIKLNDFKFKPRSFFDFGSGIGTGTWVASEFWKDSIFEYFNVDSSRDMNDLADLILRDENQQMNLKNVFFRQFLPAKDTQYDLVISSFTLFEISSKQNRSDILSNLWQRCSNYLVLVEEGTRSGFELINEARDFIINEKFENLNQTGFVFAPCSHDLSCPRMLEKTDKTPCNFEIQYEPLSFEKKTKKRHLYSYLILKKGKKYDEPTQYVDWPRIVRPNLTRSKHSICRFCTKNGKLEEIIFTASKHGKLQYHCARSSRWGDKLPIDIDKTSQTD